MNIRINVIVPKKALFDKARFIDEVKSIMHRKTEPELRAMFQGTTQGWKEQPDFVSHHFQTSSVIGVQVYTMDSVYGMVNAGSPAHLITPRNSGFLRFQVGYRSATRPGSLSSGSYRRFGAFVSTQRVRHPGFEARKFDEQIGEEYGDTFVEDINGAMARGIP